MKLEKVVALLVRECRKAGSQKAWADRHGLSGAFVSDAIHGRREPGPTLLDALGLERAPAEYRRKRKRDG
jgi:DNA-binding transcriptional regulator YdaS (Cro superfamily)